MRAGQQAPVCPGSRKRELHSPPPLHLHLHCKAGIEPGAPSLGLIWAYGLWVAWSAALFSPSHTLGALTQCLHWAGLGLSVFLVLTQMLLGPALLAPQAPGQARAQVPLLISRKGSIRALMPSWAAVCPRAGPEPTGLVT